MASSKVNAPPAYGGIFAIVAVIAGFWAIVESATGPLEREMTHLSDQLDELRQELNENDDKDITEHAELSGAISESGIRLENVEARFDGLEDLIELRELRSQARLGKLEGWREDDTKLVRELTTDLIRDVEGLKVGNP